MITEALRTFRIAYETGNYVIAAEKLGIEHSTITRQIHKLEKHFGVKLVETSPRGTQFTYEGQLLYEGSTPLVLLKDDLETKIRRTKETLAGPLNVFATTTGIQWLALHAKEFKQRYPEIDLYFGTDDWKNFFTPSTVPGMTVGLIAGTPPKDSPFLWEKIRAPKFIPFAHPHYLEEFGTPQELSDLDHHQLIRYTWSPKYKDLCPQQSNLLLYAGRSSDNPRSHCMSADDVLACLGLISSEAGIGCLPPYLARKFGLISVLENESQLSDPFDRVLYFVCPPALKEHARVLAFKNFILEKSLEAGF